MYQYIHLNQSLHYHTILLTPNLHHYIYSIQTKLHKSKRVNILNDKYILRLQSKNYIPDSFLYHITLRLTILSLHIYNKSKQLDCSKSMKDQILYDMSILIRLYSYYDIHQSHQSFHHHKLLLLPICHLHIYNIQTINLMCYNRYNLSL